MSVLHSQKLFPGMSQQMDRHSSEFCLLDVAVQQGMFILSSHC